MQGWIQGEGGGGHGGLMSPPLVTEQALNHRSDDRVTNAEVYDTLSARSYFDTAHTSALLHVLQT